MITAIKCPHCCDIYDKSKAEGLNMYSTRCLKCNMPYIPNENEFSVIDVVFNAIRRVKGG